MPLQVEYFPSSLAGLYFSWALVIYWILIPGRAGRSGFLRTETFWGHGCKVLPGNTFGFGNSCLVCTLGRVRSHWNKRVTHSLEPRLTEQWSLENTSEIIISVIFRLLEKTMPAHPAHPRSQHGNAIAQIKISEYFCLLPGLRQPRVGNDRWLRLGVTSMTRRHCPLCVPQARGAADTPGRAGGWPSSDIQEFKMSWAVPSSAFLPHSLPALPHLWPLATLKQALIQRNFGGLWKRGKGSSCSLCSQIPRLTAPL